MTAHSSARALDAAGLSLHEFPLDELAIAASVLNIEDKARSNLFPWNGQFSPQLVEAILSHYARPGMVIFDPFCGSGTVLYEAGRFDLDAIGSEVNPAAFHLARIYTLVELTQAQRASLLRDLDDDISDFAAPECPTEDEDVREQLLHLAFSLQGSAKIIAEALVILSDFGDSAPAERVWRAWTRLRRAIEQLRSTDASIAVDLRDCRSGISADRSIDLVLTSPPYINVYNYHQQYRGSAEALGWDLLAIAKSEIGANRKHRGNRFLTVTQYCLDMAANLAAMATHLADAGRIIMVLGRESRVRGVPFFNAEIVAQLGLECADIELLQRQERVFTNRFGQKIVEDILHFGKRHDRAAADIDRAARVIATRTLTAARRNRMDSDVREDLEAAIAAVDSTQPSPLLEHGRHYRRQRFA